jgi:phage FluMu gp28-like protein
MPVRSTPIVPLLEWQRRYLEDESRFKLVVASVQSGKSFATSLEFALRALRPKRSLGILLSASERQSVELMEKVKMHTQGWGVAAESGFFQQTSIVQHTATFPNGNRIIALPANPDTARGYSGDVFLDEFALHRDAKAIWAAMMGRATRGYDVRVASTFKGHDNKFYELAKGLNLHEGVRPAEQPVRRNGWSGHWVDIYMCREQGLDVDIEGLRQAIDDDAIFQQEYANVPQSEAESFIPVELVLGCESGEASMEWAQPLADGRGSETFAGFDVGRKKDRSVIWIVERTAGDVLLTRGVIWMDRMAFAEQLKIARSVAAAVERFAIDATGIGAMLAEELEREFPWVEPVDFTAGRKERMAVEVKKRFEERTIRVPEDRRIRRACGAVKRHIGPTGGIRFDAARTDAGHADEFWSLALACAAAAVRREYVPASACGLVGRTTFAGVLARTF